MGVVTGNFQGGSNRYQSRGWYEIFLGDNVPQIVGFLLLIYEGKGGEVLSLINYSSAGGGVSWLLGGCLVAG